MNKVILCGRLTKDPEMKQAKETVITRYTLAVDRPTRDKETDFLNCVSFGKAAEFSSNYFKKGMRVLVSGRIQTGCYTNKEGIKVYNTDIVVDSQEFADGKENKSNDGFVTIPNGVDNSAPWENRGY